ncbi:MAG: heterodisulfide reductase-related iron-sulfur binding cluster [Candidatus Thiodiazotropha sp.]
MLISTLTINVWIQSQRYLFRGSLNERIKCEELDIQLNEIPDWNYCGASIGYGGGGELPRLALSARKIAGYVGCQTNRPFGIAGESFENPQYLDKIVESVGAESIPGYEKKVQCCGGALAFSEPEKSQEMIKGIIEAAYDNGADMIVTPCPLCQANVEIYQDNINETYGTKFNMPVVYYSTLMSVAFGRSAADAALNGQVIPAKQLEEIANK